MLTAVIAIALLSGPDASTALRSRKADSDPNRMVCKYGDEPGSRIQRRKVCLTAQQWEEWKLIERLNLLRNQFNGAQ